jgi:hypothetical protein
MRWRSRLWLATLVALGCGDVSIAPTAELAVPHAAVEHTATLEAVDGGVPGDASSSPEARVAACLERAQSFADEHRYEDDVRVGDQVVGRYEAWLADSEITCRRKAYFPGRDEEFGLLGREIHLWPDAIVRFTIDEAFDAADPNRPGRTKADRIRELVRSFAMQHHVSFVELPRTTSVEQRLHIQSNGIDFCGGNADVGYELGLSVGDEFPRKVRLRDVSTCAGWDMQRVVHHELGHLIGMAHEHQRSDRDDYLRTYPEYFIPDFVDDYDKNEYSSPRGGSAYDYDSIMHYSPWGAAAGRPSMLMRRRWDFLVQRAGSIVRTDLADASFRRVQEDAVGGVGPNVRGLEAGPSGVGIEPLATVLTDGPTTPDGVGDLVTFQGNRLYRAALNATEWSNFGPAASFALERAELAVGDVTADGSPDLIVAGQAGSVVVIGVFRPLSSAWQWTSVSGAAATVRMLHLVDWDGDGVLDPIVRVTGSNDRLVIGRFRTGSTTLTTQSISGNPDYVLVGNFDLDAQAETLVRGDRYIRNQNGSIARDLGIPIAHDPAKLGYPRVTRRATAFGGGATEMDEILYLTGSGTSNTVLRQLRDGTMETVLRSVFQREFSTLDDVVFGAFAVGSDTVELWISRGFIELGSTSDLSTGDIAAIDTAYPDDANPGHFMAIGGGVFVPFPCAIDEAFGYCP